MIALGESIVC